MFYAVVEFKSQNSQPKEYAVVPLQWLLKNERRCYWPSSTGKLPLQLFVKRCPPANKNWRHYPVAKIHLKTEIYNLAKQEMERLIEECDNLSTASSASGAIRKPSPTDSETSDTDSAENGQSTVKKAKQTNYMAVKQLSSSANALPMELLSSLTPIGLTPTASTNILDSEFASAFNNDIIVGNLSSPAQNTTFTDAGFQDTTLSALANLQTTADQILITTQEILRYNKKIAIQKLIAPEGLPLFPLNSYEEFLRFDSVLKADSAVSQYMVQRLAAIGGSGLEGVTRRILKFLMSNQLATHFNWKGRHSKKGFENTKMMGIIYESAKLNFPNNERSDLQIASSVKEWLKHATTRINQGKRRTV